jgi:N-acetyl-beta-hexosaminidase
LSDRNQLAEAALRAFKPGAFSDRVQLTIRHPHVARRAHFLVEPYRAGWRMTIRVNEQESVQFFDTLGEVNRARQQLSDIGIIGLIEVRG